MLKSKRIVYALLFAALFFTEVIIALFVHDNFIRSYIGDLLVTVLLCSFLRIFIPEKIKALPIFVFIFSVLVEFAQYIDIVKLLGAQNNKFLSVIVGRYFSVIDIICYALGCILFLILDRYIISRK